ncbi:hypothetical protein GH5_01102 [Leishmania sp. Ghana 2012 LV757]|uniref:hypothetical protein n=1 Tax=Leishmania sp. Ghana 2012 LV757 TaxID=2803181 RepID=UPI001B627B39|nr:hypothetical protein GH5_01102 [Leishmania sp. Ghana 2012 LV757]
MFRSWGELTRSACEVFDLFAEPISAVRLANGTAVSQDAVTTADAGLSRVGLECAFYVLFGRYPDPSLIVDCFARAPPSAFSTRGALSVSLRQAPREARGAAAAHGTLNIPLGPSNVSGPSRAGRMFCVTRPAYLRFVTLCAEEEGEGFVTEHPQGDATGGATATAVSVECEKAAELQWWRQFHSVAGPKGFIDADDLLGINLQSPFSDVQEVLAPPSSMSTCDSAVTAQRKKPVSRQAPLVQHVFWMLDRDHDGSVRFDDVRPFLQEC